MAITFQIRPGNERPITVTRPDKLARASVFLRDKIQGIPDGGIVELEACEPGTTPTSVRFVLKHLRDGSPDPDGRRYDVQFLAEVCNVLVAWECDPVLFRGLWDMLNPRSSPGTGVGGTRCWNRKMKKKDAMAAKPLAISALVLGQHAALEREIGTVVWALDDRLETTVFNLQHLDAIRAEEQQHIFHDVSHQVFRLYADRSDQRTIKLADDIIQRVRDRNLGEITDNWNENCATHPELRTYNPYKLLRRFEDAVKPPEARPHAVPPAPNGHHQPPGSRSFPIDLGELRQVVGQGISNVVRRRSNGDNALSTIENIFDVVEQRVELRQRDLALHLIQMRDEMVAEWRREIENPGSTRRPSLRGIGGDQRRSSSSVSLAEPRSMPPPPSGYRELDNGEGSSRDQRTRIPPPPSWSQDPWSGTANGRYGTSEREQFRAAELSSVSTRRKPTNTQADPNDPFVPRAGNTFPQYHHNGGINGVNRLGELLHVQANLEWSEEGSWRHGDDIWRLKVPWR